MLDRQLSSIADEVNDATANMGRAESELAQKKLILRRRLVDIYKRGPLYTTEAMRLYVSKLAPGGILAFDVTLGSLDLPQHVADAASASGASCYAREDLEPSVTRLLAGVFPSSWIACGIGSADALGPIRSDPRWHQLPENPLDAWTDGRLPAAEALRLGSPPS